MGYELQGLEKLRKARVSIQRSNPFFAYLSLYLKPRAARKGEIDEFAGMGVSASGDLIYKDEFVNKISDNELVGVIVHEVLHLALLHLTRLGARDRLVWNLAADICVNKLVEENGFTLPSGAVKANYNHEIELFGVKVTECHKKSAEQIYDELKVLAKNKEFKKWASENGFDKHIFGKLAKNEDGKKGGEFKEVEYSESDIKQLQDYWKDKMEEAYITSKMRGNIPKGIERLIGKVHEEQVSWKTLLMKSMEKIIPTDFSYSMPSRKSISCGIYMPSMIREMVEVCIAIDTSGSIGTQELTDFLSEIVGMSKAYGQSIKMRVLAHDYVVQDDLVVSNGNISKIEELKIKGGGGTAHKPVFEYVLDNVRDAKMVVCFTDGYSDLNEVDFERYPFEKVFVISQGGDAKQLDNKRATIIKLGGHNE